MTRDSAYPPSEPEGQRPGGPAVISGSLVSYFGGGTTNELETNGRINGPDIFRSTFGSYLQNPSVIPPHDPDKFAELLQDMLHVAADRAIPTESPLYFQPISSFYYRDGVRMSTLAGVLCKKVRKKTIRKEFSKWPLANLDWKILRSIDIPSFSTKERLHLQPHLPARGKGAGKLLYSKLKYLVTGDIESTKRELANYGEFHRLLPYFNKVIP